MIQVAGVKSREDLETIQSAHVDYVGFPLRLKYHDDDLPPTRVKELVATLRGGRAKPVLITYLHEASAVIELAGEIGVSVVQLHGDVSLGEMEKLKDRMPEVQIIKSLIVREGNFDALKTALNRFTPLVDYFITDTFDPETGAEGATGKTHDWNVSRALVALSARPIILAGGLNSENVSEAIRMVRPAGVDVHTGIENDCGFKDPVLTSRFAERARQAFEGRLGSS